ncbi:MAG: MFS transporter [Aestuariivirga sp.]
MTTLKTIRARWAVAAVFLLHGMLMGGWVAHIPLAKERLEVGPAVFGLALLAIAAGAVFAMLFTGAAIQKYGSARVTVVTGIGFALTFLGPITAPTYTLFCLGGFFMGMTIGSMDVAMNSHGLAVERALKLPTMSLFHGMFSLGAMAGTFIGAAVMNAVGPLPQALIFAIIYLVLLIVAMSYLLPASVDKGEEGASFVLPSMATLGLGLLCFLALMIEGSILDWGAIFLRERFAMEAETAALAFGVYQGGLAVARFTGDVLRLKFGAVRLVTVSAWMTAVGTAVALFAPWPATVFVGFVIAGLGIGNIAPVLFAGGGRLEPESPGHGIAAVTTLGYTGFLAGPPLIGFTAEVAGLQLALGLTVIAAIIIAVFARAVDAADTF